MEFIAQVGVSVMQILTHAHQGLIEGQAGFDADDGEVESVGQAKANALLAVSDHALQNEAREEESKAGDAEPARNGLSKPAEQRYCRQIRLPPSGRGRRSSS